MTNGELGAILFAMLLLLVAATLLGQLFARFRQPKVVGEILAGVLLGPTLLGEVAPGFAADVFGDGRDATPRPSCWRSCTTSVCCCSCSCSGCAVKRLLGKENRKPTAWILGLGTPLPFFIALIVAPLLPLEQFTGSAGSESGGRARLRRCRRGHVDPRDHEDLRRPGHPPHPLRQPAARLCRARGHHPLGRAVGGHRHRRRHASPPPATTSPPPSASTWPSTRPSCWSP